MQQLFNNRWFALSELIYVIFLSWVIYLLPESGGWLVILILIPWLLGLVFKRITIERTFFVIPIVIFFITAGVGVWAAYDQPASVEKLWIIFGAFAVFVTLVNQPKENMGVVASLVGLLGVFIAIIFLATNDWHSQSSDLDIIRRAGDWIVSVRPAVEFRLFTPNFAGGLLAILAPIPTALGIYYWQDGQRWKSILAGGMVLVILGGMFLSSSRGAWLALIFAAGLWLVWQLSSYLGTRSNKPAMLIFGLLLLIIVLPLVWIISLPAGGFIDLVDQFPGLPTGGSRYELAVNTTKLIGDYPITGGGLRGFAGQYSQYILVIPFFLFAYSHNLYLDVIFEQGILGGMALVGLILGACLYLMARHGSLTHKTIAFWLSAAAITSTFVLLVHGWVDDPLYGDLGSPLLFLVPGFALMLSRTDNAFDQGDIAAVLPEGGGESRHNPVGVLIPAVIVVLVFAGILIFRDPVQAGWHANLGAVEMAKIDLAGWPQNQWNPDRDTRRYLTAQMRFEEAISLDQSQRTAWHRSGLIAAQGRAFDKAQYELENAHQIDQDHRGIKKALGYVYAWNGEISRAAEMLQGIDEAAEEVEAYIWWWQDNQEPGYAGLAEDLARLLKP